MIPPFGQTAQPDFADELMAEAGARISARQEQDAAERRAMSPEQLMKLEKQIEALKERGCKGEDVYEQLQELRREHYRGTGASGG
jgi:hypothetical protein